MRSNEAELETVLRVPERNMILGLVDVLQGVLEASKRRLEVDAYRPLARVQ